MLKGERIRFNIHNILYSVYKFNKSLNNNSIKQLIHKQKKEDVAFIYNVTLNSMRLNFHCVKIIKKFIKKKLRDHEKILLISAITQIVFLNFKEYAVINCSVEIAKKLKLYPGLINATLKKIAANKTSLSKIKINFYDLPYWFQEKTKALTEKEKKSFVDNFYKEPNIHIVFKNQDKLIKFEKKLIKSSDISGFLVDKKDIENNKSFKDGDWWVQDYSSFLPLYNFWIKNKNLKFLDTCAAPGGKSFQLLSNNLNVLLNDKSKTRIKILKSNLVRLNFNKEVLNKDFLKFDEKDKFDIIIIDAPCSAVGTIKKNPDIFFKTKNPNFEEIISLQEKMLEKASILLEKGGYIIYMTCSFLEIETTGQIDKFLNKNTKFLLSDFNVANMDTNYAKLIKNGFMMTLPTKILNNYIDGFFCAYLKKV